MKLWILIRFIITYLFSLLLANLRIAFDILRPGLNIQPGIILIRIRAQTDFELMVFTNLLMMTPGTMALDISKDRNWMSVHVMYLHDVKELRKELEVDLQNKVLEVLR